MPRIVFVNGDFVQEDRAMVSVFDRGFLMGDAIYEVTTVLNRKLIEFDAHMTRLKRSLDALEIPYAVDSAALLDIHRNLIEKNGIKNGTVYIQVSRGAADRSFHYPEGIEPTVVAFTQDIDWLAAPFVESGLKVVSHPDKRWGRRDIKTTQLLWGSMSMMAAKRGGVDDVWFVQNGEVTEGSFCNAFIVKDRKIITRELSNDILHGTMRASILGYARQNGFEVEERTFSISEAQSADEAFVTASPLFATGVVEIDGKMIGNGKPGAVTLELRKIILEESLKTGV